MPLMRHPRSWSPRDRTATAREDQFRVGPALLAAPVAAIGAGGACTCRPAGGSTSGGPRRSTAVGGLRSAARGRCAAGARGRARPVGELPARPGRGAAAAAAAEVDTLADVPGAARSRVGLRDRRDRLVRLPARAVQREPDGPTGACVVRLSC